MSTIDLSTPVRRELRPLERIGENHAMRTVFVYTCPTCKGEVRVRAGSFRGINRNKPIAAVPGVGAIGCPHCAREAVPA